MKRFSILACALLAVAPGTFAQQPPYISDNFQSGVIINGVPWNADETQQVFGFYAQDASNQRSLLVGNFSTALLYDTKLYEKKIEADWIPNSTYCQVKALTESFGPLFQWVAASTFEGYSSISGVMTEHWSLNVTQSPALLSSLHIYTVDHSVPLRLVVADASHQQTVIFDFYNYQSVQPPADWFNLPPTCPQKYGRDDGDRQRGLFDGEDDIRDRSHEKERTIVVHTQQRKLVVDAHQVLARIAKLKFSA